MQNANNIWGEPSPYISLYSSSHLDPVELLKYLLPIFLPWTEEKINSAQAEDRQKALVSTHSVSTRRR